MIQPIGDRVMTPFGKLMGSTVSPDGRHLVGTSADRSVDLQVFDLSTYRPVAAAGTLAAASFATAAANAGYADIAYLKISDGTVGQEGPVFSPDGKFLSTPVGGTIIQTFAVGIAPRQLEFVGTRLYVSNEGGRPAVAGETTMGSYGTQVPADTTLGTSATGMVSVIDTVNASTAVASINVQLHPTAMSLNSTALYVANTNSDTVSVIDTKTGTVMQTIATQPWASSKTGYQPTAITMQVDHLLVSLGNAKAIAV